MCSAIGRGKKFHYNNNKIILEEVQFYINVLAQGESFPHSEDTPKFQFF